MPPEVRSVGQIVHYLRDLLDHDRQLADLWISGEVSNFTHARSGHIYFTIKDENAQLRCVFFRDQNIGQQDRIESGTSLIVHGKVGVFEQRGELQLIVDFVQPAGVGALQAEFERRRTMFEAEGLFALERKRPLPRFPERIGVVTSSDGAALHDVSTVLSRRWPRAHIIVSPTLVQGDTASASVAAAIRDIVPLDRPASWPDLLIVTRGGGAAEDLWAFNEDPVNRLQNSLPDTAELHRRVSAHADAMLHLATAATATSRDATTALASRLRTLSPLATLDRGYTLIARPNGTPVSRAADVSHGDILQLRWRDGSRQARVQSGS
jgi:exonuclease VII large subunit